MEDIHFNMDLNGKVILIAGATVGIGRATAILLSQMGAKVILISSNEDRLKETLPVLLGQGHSYCLLDLSQPDTIEAAIKEITVSQGPIDGLVYCVGVRSRRPLAMLSPNILAEIMQVNFISFVELTRCITKKNRYREGLSIVGVSSISSQRGAPSVTAYAASKGAMESAVRCLAKELAPKKIRLNTVIPAQINTPAYEGLVSMNMNENKEDPMLLRQYLGLGEPEDVANIIALLLSEKSRFISGASLPVDGGFLSS
jgi:NAD(P)-dependent dehydrogenase (short-subunit alcohol dehydrogenase family)